MRILNDLVMDVDKTLLCSDIKSRLGTNWIGLIKGPESHNVILTYLNELVKCYETAIELLEER